MARQLCLLIIPNLSLVSLLINKAATELQEETILFSTLQFIEFIRTL